MSAYCGRAKLELRLLGWMLGLVAGLVAGLAASRVALAAPPGPAPSAVLRSIEGKYNRLKTLRIRFRQILRQDQRVLREEAGTLYLRKPGQMRWEYENPEPKLFLTDGRKLILYVPSENRVTETAVAASDDLRTPLRFLLGQARFAEEFSRIETSPEFPAWEKGNTVLKAYPQRMANQMEWEIFEVNPQFQIRRLILKEPGGVETEFRFQDEQSNLTLASELFRFQPPAGTEVIRQ